MFMMANIIANFVLLAAYDPLNTAATTQDKVQNDLEPWFQAVRAAPCRRALPTRAPASPWWCQWPRPLR